MDFGVDRSSVSQIRPLFREVGSKFFARNSTFRFAFDVHRQRLIALLAIGNVAEMAERGSASSRECFASGGIKSLIVGSEIHDEANHIHHSVYMQHHPVNSLRINQMV